MDWSTISAIAALAVVGALFLAFGFLAVMYVLGGVAFVLHLPWVVLNRLWRKWVPDS